MKHAEIAETARARAQVALSEARELQRDADVAVKDAERHLKDEGTIEAARAVEAARQELAATTTLLETRKQALAAADAELARAKREDARAELAGVETERDRLRVEFGSLFETFARIHRDLRMAIDAVEQICERDHDLTRRAAALAVEGDAIVEDDALDLIAARLVIGAALAETVGLPKPVTAPSSPDFRRAVSVLADFAGSPHELDATLRVLAEEWAATAGPAPHEWLRVLDTPSPTDHSAHARRARAAFRLLDALRRTTKEDPCPVSLANSL